MSADAWPAGDPAAFRPPRPNPHTLSPGTPFSCYQWTTRWTGHRADRTRVSGAYVLRVVPKATGAALDTTTASMRFDLR